MSTASAVAVGVDAVRPLRAEVLRGGGPLATAVWPGDDDPRTGHYAVLGEDGEPLAVGSVVLEGGGWRVRGMATSPAARGRGYGTVVLAALLEHARTHGGGLVWCNARPRAQSLYERAGFKVVSEEFDVPGTGPHRRLER